MAAIKRKTRKKTNKHKLTLFFTLAFFFALSLFSLLLLQQKTGVLSFSDINKKLLASNGLSIGTFNPPTPTPVPPPQTANPQSSNNPSSSAPVSSSCPQDPSNWLIPKGPPGGPAVNAPACVCTDGYQTAKSKCDSMSEGTTKQQEEKIACYGDLYCQQKAGKFGDYCR